MANKTWTADQLLALGRSYQAAAVYAAAAELDLFDALAGGALATKELARKLRCDFRGLGILLDALTALRLLNKQGGRYTLPGGAAKFLTSCGPQSILAMAQHQANCLRNWAQLARVVKTGQPAERTPSVRGADSDAVAFIGAMDNIANVFQALTPGGRIAIRDILMEPSRTRPVAGSLFAVNMLVATPGGGTFTFDELREDLESAGFTQATVVRQDEAMNSIVMAKRPNKNEPRE